MTRRPAWHVIHKPTAKTLCGQPNDGTKPAEGEPCNGCATAMYDVFGEVLDELEAERAKQWIRRTTVWPVFEVDPGSDVDLAVIGATLDAAQRAAEDHVDARLTWTHRHTFADSQEYRVAEHDGCEYHTYEWDVQP